MAIDKKRLFYARSVDGLPVFDNKKELTDFMSKNSNKTFKVIFERETGIRTPTQNSSLHLYFTLLADALNEAGYTVQLVLKEKVDLDWSPSSVKELLWRPAQEALTGKKSTIDLGKVEEIDLVWEHLNRHISERFGIHIPFPTKEQLK